MSDEQKAQKLISIFVCNKASIIGKLANDKKWQAWKVRKSRLDFFYLKATLIHRSRDQLWIRNKGENHHMSKEKMLNREVIVSTIKKICSINYNKFTVSDLIHKGGHRHRVEINADGWCFYVDFHFRENGSTSIDTSSGHHIDKKKQIKDAILGDLTCMIIANEKSS